MPLPFPGLASVDARDRRRSVRLRRRHNLQSAIRSALNVVVAACNYVFRGLNPVPGKTALSRQPNETQRQMFDNLWFL